MKNENQIYLSSDIQLGLKSLSNKLVSLLSSVENDVLTRESGSDANNIMIHTRLQTIFNLKLSNPIERKLLEIILSHAMVAERMGPGAFTVTLQRLLEYLGKSWNGNQPVFNENILSDTRRVLSRFANKEDIESIVYNRIRNIDHNISEMLISAVDLAGFGGRIFVEKTHANQGSVELLRGYTFDVSPMWSISIRIDEPRIFVIDGYVEQVSEIHHLLEAANEAKEPAVIFLRGISNDVLHTLKVNFDRGTLKVLPIVVKYDLEGINTVNDIAIVSGCNMISSLKGDLISSIKFNDAPRVDSIFIYPTKIVIQHRSTSTSVSQHVTTLRKKRNEISQIEDVHKLYDKRIRSLSPSHVVIRIPDNKDFVRKSQAIDNALRTIKSLVDFGVTNTNQPMACVVSADIHAKKCFETLMSIGAVIIEKTEEKTP